MMYDCSGYMLSRAGVYRYILERTGATVQCRYSTAKWMMRVHPQRNGPASIELRSSEGQIVAITGDRITYIGTF